MTTGPKPPAEVTIDPSLVRALLQEQHTDLAQLALIDIGEGWDNFFLSCPQAGLEIVDGVIPENRNFALTHDRPVSYSGSMR